MAPTPPGQTILFVGGAPRSGTTVLHQLLCTSEKTNAYHPEISFVLPIIEAYTRGLSNWDNHTKTFFAVPEHFRMHIANHVEGSMQHISRVFKNPQVLTVKNPNMTPFFPTIRELLRERAKFVCSIRHPYTIVRSQQKVEENFGRPFTTESAKLTAQQIMQNYAHLDDPTLKGQEFVLKYEDILDPSVLDDLRAFTGMADIDPDKVGGSKKAAFTEAEKSNPWFSPKYHAKIDTSNRLSPLDKKYRKAVYEICAPLMERFDYSDEA